MSGSLCVCGWGGAGGGGGGLFFFFFFLNSLALLIGSELLPPLMWPFIFKDALGVSVTQP